VPLSGSSSREHASEPGAECSWIRTNLTRGIARRTGQRDVLGWVGRPQAEHHYRTS
jgi:hypothetical protein